MKTMIPEDAVVTQVKEESNDTRTLTMRLADGRGMEFEPGQFNMLGLPGMGEAPYTFSHLAHDGEFAHSVRAVGRVSKALCKVKQGERVQVRGPFGSSWPWEKAKGKDVLVVAGGAGVVPLRPFIEKVLANRSEVGRLRIFHGARTPGQMLFQEDVAAWLSAPDTEVRLIVDEVPGGGPWEGKVGVVTELFDHPSAGAGADIALVCGPELMMRFVVHELLLRRMRETDIYLSMERHMKCGVGHCGHCQIGSNYVCRDGPVFTLNRMHKHADTVL